MDHKPQTPQNKGRSGINAWLAACLAVTLGILLVSFLPSTVRTAQATTTNRGTASSTAATASANQSRQLIEQLQQAFYYIQEAYVDQVDPTALYEGAMRGLFESLGDPYSVYLTSNELRALNDTATGTFGGVGLYISKRADSEEGAAASDLPNYVEIISPIEGTPAFQAGLRSGDLITAVEDASTADLTIDEVVNLLRGRPGTSVRVSIQRGSSVTFDVSLQRAVIEVPTVREAMIAPGIGYIRIIQFTPYSGRRFREAVTALQGQGYTSLIIDLRSNPGGLLTSVIEVADHMFSDGNIVSTRSRIAGENSTFDAQAGQIVPNTIPIVVLINHGSASAAEILAGALGDRNRAIIVGQTSYGKGSVQSFHQLGDGAFKLTTSRYYTPAGVSIDHVGIVPDVPVVEPELSQAEEESLVTLLSGDRIQTFVGGRNNAPSNADIAGFIQTLRGEGITLSDRILRKLVRDEVNSANNTSPIFDLDYDLTLQEGLRVIRNPPATTSNPAQQPATTTGSSGTTSTLPAPRTPQGAR